MMVDLSVAEIIDDHCHGFRVEELLAVSPAPMLILSGGEPLLRDDLTEIAAYASQRGATVVVGTNGTLLSDERITALQDAGVASSVQK